MDISRDAGSIPAASIRLAALAHGGPYDHDRANTAFGAAVVQDVSPSGGHWRRPAGRRAVAEVIAGGLANRRGAVVPAIEGTSVSLK